MVTVFAPRRNASSAESRSSTVQTCTENPAFSTVCTNSSVMTSGLKWTSSPSAPIDLSFATISSTFTGTYLSLTRRDEDESQ